MNRSHAEAQSAQRKAGTEAGVSETIVEMAAERLDPAAWAAMQLTKPDQPRPETVGEVHDRIKAIMGQAIEMEMRNRLAGFTGTEREFIEMVRSADAVLVHSENGLRLFSYIRGMSDAPAHVRVQYAAAPGGGRCIRHLTIRMGLTEKQFAAASAPQGETGSKRRAGRARREVGG